MLKVTYDSISKTLDRIMPHIIFAVSPENIEDCATRLNLLRHGVLELGNLAQEALFYEYHLFHTIVRGKPFITNILEDLKLKLTDEEQAIVSDYGNARFAVLRVEAIVNEDAVTVFDWVQEKPRLLLIDKDAHHLKIDDLLVCHIMDLNDFVMTTGAWLRFPHKSKESTRILDIIKKSKDSLKQRNNPEFLEDCIAQIYQICLSPSLLKGYPKSEPNRKETHLRVIH